MRIGELSRQSGVPARMLRYYEERGLLHPQRQANGYRSYVVSAVDRVRQIRGLLDAGMSSQVIADVLPFLDNPPDVTGTAHCLPSATLARIGAELDRLQQRIDCLTAHRDAIQHYLATASRNPPAPPSDPQTRRSPRLKAT